MEAATVHPLFPGGEIPDDAPTYAEALARMTEAEAKLVSQRTLADLEDEIAGHIATIKSQSRRLGAQQKLLDQFHSDDPAAHPRGAEIVALIDRWKRGSGHDKATTGAGRVKLVKARLADGYALTSDEWLPDFPTLELAIDGLCAFPFRVYDRRYRDGKASNRDDDLKAALKDEAAVEQLSRRGYEARREGWVTWGEES